MGQCKHGRRYTVQHQSKQGEIMADPKVDPKAEETTKPSREGQVQAKKLEGAVKVTDKDSAVKFLATIAEAVKEGVSRPTLQKETMGYKTEAPFMSAFFTACRLAGVVPPELPETNVASNVPRTFVRTQKRGDGYVLILNQATVEQLGSAATGFKVNIEFDKDNMRLVLTPDSPHNEDAGNDATGDVGTAEEQAAETADAGKPADPFKK